MHGAVQYKRRQPEKSLLYQVVQDNIGAFIRARAREGKELPRYVVKEFEEYLRCGRLENGLVRVWCEGCKHEIAVALSCKKRGFCPSCCGKRMVETAAHLVDNVLPIAPYRQWVLTLPVPLRFRCATNRKLAAKVHRIIIKNIENHYISMAKRSGVQNLEPGSITFVQHFGSALQFNLHYHILFLDGVFSESGKMFSAAEKLQDQQVEVVLAAIAEQIIKLCRKRGFISDDPDQVQSGEMDSLFGESSAISAALSASIKGKIAFGPRAGKNVRFIGEGFGFQEEIPLAKGNLCYSQDGFSIHSATQVHDYDRPRLEKLIKYIERDAIARQLILFGEIFRRRLYAREGYDSLFTYLMRAHGFSRATAYQRAVIAKAGLRWQELLRLIGGRLISLEGAAQVGNALLGGGDESLLEKASGLTNEQIEILILGEKSLPKARDSIRTIGVIDLSSGAESSSHATDLEFSAQGQRRESPEQSRKNSEVELGSTEQCPSPLVSPREVDGKSVVVKISFATNHSVAKKLQRVKDLLARKVPDDRLSDVLDHLLDSYIEHHDPTQVKSAKRKASTPARHENSSKDNPSTGRDRHFGKMKEDLISTTDSSGRGPISNERLEITADGKVKLRLKTRWADGTTHLLFAPGEFIEKLMALMPPRKAHLVRWGGVLAPNSPFRAEITLRPEVKKGFQFRDEKAPGKFKNYSWSKMLRQVFKIDVTKCEGCGGDMVALAAIHDPDSIQRYLRHQGLDPDPPKIAPARHHQGRFDFDQVPAEPADNIIYLD